MAGPRRAAEETRRHPPRIAAPWRGRSGPERSPAPVGSGPGPGGPDGTREGALSAVRPLRGRVSVLLPRAQGRASSDRLPEEPGLERPK